MISWKELSGTVNYVYKRSIDVSELTKKSDLLAKEISAGWLSEENYQSAEALHIRTCAKIYALKYFFEGYSAEDYHILQTFINEKLLSERVKTYTNTMAVLVALKDYAQAVNDIMADAEAEKLRVINSVGEFVAVTCEEYESVSLVFAEKKEKALLLPEWQTVFGKSVIFPDVKAQVISDLTEVYNLTALHAEKLRFGEAEKFYLKNVTVIDQRSKYRRYNFYPLLSGNETKLSNVIFLYTPFEEEAALAAVKNCSGDIGYLEAVVFSNLKKEMIENFFAVATRRKCNLIIYGVEKLSGSNIDCIFSSAIDFGKNGLKVFFVDFSGTRKLYERALSAARANGYSAMDVSYSYLTMPFLDDVVSLFEELKLISDSNEEKADICKKFPFMGYVGMNEAIIAFSSEGDWRETAKSYSKRNQSAVRHYLDNVPSQSLFIERSWGNFSEDTVIDKEIKFDYDDLNEVDKRNIQYIMQKRMSVFAKCGCIVKYCTLAGADKSVWKQLDRKTQEERLTKATKLIFRVLTVDIDPEVKVLDKLDSPGAGGLCCEGGKRILYRTDCAQDYDYIIDCICHESYHAFQHLVMYGAWSDWYWTEFGVTQGRRDEWLSNTNDSMISESGEIKKKTRGSYFSDTSSDAYYVQVRECEARAFAKDCMRESKAVWHEMDFE